MNAIIVTVVLEEVHKTFNAFLHVSTFFILVREGITTVLSCRFWKDWYTCMSKVLSIVTLRVPIF